MRILAIVIIVLFLASEAVCVAAGQGKALGHRSDAISPGYMNAALHRAKNLKPVKKESKLPLNPHNIDQGNLGKLRMRDPFGFDKDSDRVGRERGRPIVEGRPVIEGSAGLRKITTTEFTITDSYITYLQDELVYWEAMVEEHPDVWHYEDRLKDIESLVRDYLNDSHDRVMVGVGMQDYGPGEIEYILTFTLPEGCDERTLVVTTTLTCIDGYDGYWVDYDAGEAVMEETLEIVLTSSDSIAFSYTPPEEIVDIGEGFLAELSITVADPETGESYTIDYKTDIYLYRWPFLYLDR